MASGAVTRIKKKPDLKGKAHRVKIKAFMALGVVK